MRSVFADAMYWIAYANPGDQWRAAAARAFAQLEDDVEIVTTEEVLTEFLTSLSGRGAFLRATAVEIAREIVSAPDVEVVAQSHESFLDGLARYASRMDKGYSLQDCISMNVMETRGITEVLTNDHHFEQEGFVVLMRGGEP